MNHKEKIVIFGAWDRFTKGNMTLIFSEDWNINSKGRKRPGFSQSREHIQLIEEKGYKLKTFAMKHSYANKGESGPARIKDFVPKLDTQYLTRFGRHWFASDNEISIQIAEEVDEPEKFPVGASKIISVNSFERDPVARAKCLAHHGYKCAVCSFDFEEIYGALGKNFIHVHHVFPFSQVKKEYLLDPIKDLVPVCPNCHAMIHRTRPILTVEQLRDYLKTRNV
ncbi:MAG: HNH endonuclease [Anaerolineales bacterium]|nr:HNH endonuclease [Anaerolineales bacterium]